MIAGGRRLGGAAALFVLCAVAASGQTDLPASPGPWQIGVFGGWFSGSRPYVFHGAVTDDVALEGAPAYGLRVARDLNAGLGLELRWTQTRPEESFVTLRPSDIRTLVVNDFEADLDWYFGRGPVRGFAVFGLGGSSTGSAFGGANFTGTAGLGVEAFLDRHFAIRVEGRANESYGNVGRDGAPAFCDAAGCYFYKRSWYASGTVTAGLTYAF